MCSLNSQAMSIRNLLYQMRRSSNWTFDMSKPRGAVGCEVLLGRISIYLIVVVVVVLLLLLLLLMIIILLILLLIMIIIMTYNMYVCMYVCMYACMHV